MSYYSNPYDCDDSCRTVVNIRHAKAAKSHGTCCHCNKTIDVGQEYTRIMYIDYDVTPSECKVVKTHAWHCWDLD